MQLINALTMQGSLQKQKPGIFKLYQDRYFAIRGQGQFLVWFKKKPINVDQNPHGILNIDAISQCKIDPNNDRQFSIQYGSRKFLLRAVNILVSRTIMIFGKDGLNPYKLSQSIEKNQINQIYYKQKHGNGIVLVKKLAKKLKLKINYYYLMIEINDRSLTILGKAIQSPEIMDLEKGILHGFHIKKGLINDKQRWYFLYSTFNLQDQTDDNYYSKNTQLFDHLNKRVRKLSKILADNQSQSEDSNQEIRGIFKPNIIYQYDPQKCQLKHQYPLIDIISWQIDNKQNLKKLKIKYYLPIKQTQDGFFQQPKQQQLTLTNIYLTQLRKWMIAIQILYQKLGIKIYRQNKLAKKCQKYQIQAYVYQNQYNRDQDGNILLYLNKQSIKIDGYIIQMNKIINIKKQLQIFAKTKQQFNQQIKDNQQAKNNNKIQKTEVVVIYQQINKLILKCTNTEITKKLYKSLKKIYQNYAQNHKNDNYQRVTHQKNDVYQINPGTYTFDKKLRESSNSLNFNFYDAMQKNPKQYRKKQKKQQSFFSKFLGMFCSNQNQDDLLFI